MGKDIKGQDTLDSKAETLIFFQYQGSTRFQVQMGAKQGISATILRKSALAA